MKIRFRRGPAAGDPVLAAGEPGWDSTTLRIGDGTTAWSGLPAIGGGIQPDARVLYVAPDGSDTNSGQTPTLPKRTLAAAVEAVPSGPMIINLGPADVANPIDIGEPIDLSLRAGVIIQGLGGGRHNGAAQTGYGEPLSMVYWNGASANPLIDMRGTRNVTLQGFQIRYTNSGHTGHIIDAAWHEPTPKYTTQSIMSDVRISSPSSALESAASAVHIAGGNNLTFLDCVFEHCQYGILRDLFTNDGYANVVTFYRCFFYANKYAHVKNVDMCWSFRDCTFENLRDLSAGAIINDPGVVAYNLIVDGGWFGDVREVATPVGLDQIRAQLSGGYIRGAFIANKNDGATMINVLDGSGGFEIVGNTFHDSASAGVTAIKLGTGLGEYVVAPNVDEMVGTGRAYITPRVAPASPAALDTAWMEAHGYITWSYRPTSIQSASAPTAGVAQVVRLWVPQDGPVTNVDVAVSAAGTSLTSGQCIIGLWDAAGDLVALAPDASNRWDSTGVKTHQLSGGPHWLTRGWYDVVWWANTSGGSLPTFVRAGSSSIGNANLSGSALQYATTGTGLTDAASAPDPLGTKTASSAMYFAGIRYIP